MAAILFGGGIIGTGGVDFGVEGAEVYFFALVSDPAFPFGFFFGEPDADEFRGGVFSFFAVQHIFGLSDNAEVFSAIIEGIGVLVIDDEVVGWIHNLPVQAQGFKVIAINDDPDGVEFSAVAAEGPIEVAIAIVIPLVKNRKKAIAEGNFTEGITIFVFAIKRYGPGADTVEPIRYCQVNC